MFFTSFESCAWMGAEKFSPPLRFCSCLRTSSAADGIQTCGNPQQARKRDVAWNAALTAPHLIHAARASTALVEPHMFQRVQLLAAHEAFLAEELVLFAERHEKLMRREDSSTLVSGEA